ncbi:MAG: phosphonopyruvate decarboxylase, partial [Oscillospiraceae bacterium]|nr:phosphonopyruvate decarboxylase [Oscillospiraceae bacterium]
MNIERFAALLEADFYVGVPDSQLKPLCNYLMDRYGLDPAHHLIAANEGNAAALAAGYHLATGKIPVVYLQNSGLGNIVNPAASLLNDKVYGIPCLFIVGWRGEPGVHDEPQHIFQGEITLPLLDILDIPYFVIGTDTAEEQVREKLAEFRALFAQGCQAAFVVRKGALDYKSKPSFANGHPMGREEAIGHILAAAGDDPVVSTTGKASREVCELREGRGQGHGRDFLTVGS